VETHYLAMESEGQVQPCVPDLPVLIPWASQVLSDVIFAVLDFCSSRFYE